MPSFRKASKQVAHALKSKIKLGTGRRGQGGERAIHSLGTLRNYQQALIRLTEWMKRRRSDLKSVTPEIALKYLTLRSQSVSQKTLNQEKQAIELLLDVDFPSIKSALTTSVKSRAYTDAQVAEIIRFQTEKYQLATAIAKASGLRAHELFTLQPKALRSASSHRHWSDQRFIGRSGEMYTVVGKGGLIREVLIPTVLAQQLEARRLPTPITVWDRGIRYVQHYAIGGGQNWSESFSAASQRSLGWSQGAHGLRHGYAQSRLEELQQQGFLYQAALEIISQEIGHFRSEITEVYLR